MPRILSISSFSSFPLALLVGLVCIFCIELYGHNVFGKKYFSHEVDRVLDKVENTTFNADYVLIGDSVGRQLMGQFRADPRFAVLATNQAIEITGQYFLTKRYLSNNSQPTAIIFATSPLYGQNLEQNYTENFVFRPFNEISEVWSVFKAKHNPAIVTKMMAYHYFPSFKYRLKLQDKLAGFTNSSIYSGIDSASKKSKSGDYSILRILDTTFNKRKTSQIHFERFIDTLSQQEIDFHYLTVPIKKPSVPKKSWAVRQHRKLLETELPRLKQLYPATFHYDPDLIMHEASLFKDSAHYNDKGLPAGKQYMREKVDTIVNRYSRH